MSTQLALDLEARPERALVDPPSFFVRSHMSVAEVEAGKARAADQEVLILSWFEDQDDREPGVRFTPSEVHCAFLCFPLTSVRRALTVMTRKGVLAHHPGDRRPGPRGAKESTWSLRA